MLTPALLHGDQAALLDVVAAFWADVTAALQPLDIPTTGAFTGVKARRLIRFLDTDERAINGRSHIIREREDIDTGEREVTLKFRHPEWHVAADRRMDAAAAVDVRTTFEEDVKPPFVSVFSFSTT